VLDLELAEVSDTKRKGQQVWAEFTTGKKECVDEAESEAEALHLLDEYRALNGGSVKRMWLQLKRD
jgi:hypothetical protein